MDDTKIGIIITTYQRKDGKTPEYLKMALDSVFNQTYKNFKVFLIGDKYENESELSSIIERYDKNKIYLENLPYAKERDFYSGDPLWFNGGINAMNYGIDKSLKYGFEYLAHLDHDDLWNEDHLELINKCIKETKSDWICTKSTYTMSRVLPKIESEMEFVDFLPKGCTVIHSSVCINFKKIPLRYRNLYEEFGILSSSDADLWDRCREYIVSNKLKSTLINKITCRHEEEGYEKRRKN
jgi:glycosyltransferase involved in cell wall biosynthesis